MFKGLIPLFLSLTLILSACTSSPAHSSKESEDIPTSLTDLAYPLEKTEDMGQNYIDSLVFLGESTTYHLKSRGVLSGGKDTHQVWGPKSGTLMLDLSTASCRIVYPETGEELDLYEAAKRKAPKYIVLTFGLNGATRLVSRGKEYFFASYEKLINVLLSASESTTLILQSCFPIAQSMDTSGYSISPSALNEYIVTINEWTCELAKKHSLGFLNTAEILIDESGSLKEEYQVGDGYHLTREAYIKILEYIRTHGHPKEAMR